MATTSTKRTGILSDYEFYAPEFQVKIDGEVLDPTTKGDILQVKVTMDLDNMTGFDLTMNNWDDAAFDFKYTNTGSRVELCGAVEIQMGYADRLLPMVDGRITSISPRFPESGPPTVAVAGQDGLVVLSHRRPGEGEAKSYRNLTDGDIARRIAERNQLRCEADTDGPQHELVVQGDQDDATFLLERAKRIDHDVFVRTDPESGESTLHFVKPTDGRDGRPIRVYELVWGESLITFSPTVTAAQQVSSVTVRGWDPRAKQVIEATATAGRPRLRWRRRHQRAGGGRLPRPRPPGDHDRPAGHQPAGGGRAGQGPAPQPGLRVHHGYRPGDRPSRPAAWRQPVADPPWRPVQRHLLRHQGRPHARRLGLPDVVRRAPDPRGELMTAPTARQTDRRYYGIAEGIVVENEDPEGEGRVRVKLPWFSEAEITDWCRVTQLYAGPATAACSCPRSTTRCS